MSNSRVFDYTEISNLYNQMKTITGDKSDPTSIAGILEQINIDYTDVVHGVVGEDEMAIFGELGQQMLLNWENTSANFPNFVENFDAWSTLVAQAAGDYSQFEQQVQGIRTASPLGWASGGMQDSFITNSVYANALTEQEIADLAAQSQFYQLTGAEYIDTGMVSFLNKSDIWEGIELALDVATIVTAGFSVAKYVKGVTSLTTAGNARTLTTAGGTVISSANPSSITALRSSLSGTSGFGKAKEFLKILTSTNKAGKFRALVTTTTDAAGAATVLSMASMLNPAAAGYAAAGYGAAKLINKVIPVAPEQTGTVFATQSYGDVVKIGGTDYEFLGQSANGTNLYTDVNGNVVYDTGNNAVSPVTYNNNGTMTPVTIGNLTEETEMVAGNDTVGQFGTLTVGIVTEDFDGYYDTLDTNMDRLHS